MLHLFERFKFSVCTLLVGLPLALNAVETNKETDTLTDNFPLSTQTTVASLRKHTGSSKQCIHYTWKPRFFLKSQIAKKSNYFTNFNTGIGFLYFSGIKGSPSLIKDQGVLKTKKMPGSFIYNRSPLFEGSVGWNLTKSIACGISILHQGGIFIQSYDIAKRITTPAFLKLRVFNANVELNAVAAKFYYSLPFSLVIKKIGLNPYMGFLVGPSWQTWSNIRLTDFRVGNYTLFTQKISANCFFGTEAGFKIQSLIPKVSLSMILGCKFNLWGQSRQMGAAKQQKLRSPVSNEQYALNQPWSIKTIYQWAPFIGLNWDF